MAKQKLPVSEAKQNEDSDLRYGCGAWTPNWMQWMTRPKALLVVLCFFTMAQGFAVNGINNVNTTSYERRFSLPSSQVGFISSSYDISAGCTVLFVTYAGSHYHKPRMLAIAAVMLGLGSMVMTIPHFTAGLYEPTCSTSDKCELLGNSSSTSCKADEGKASALQGYLYVFIFGQILHGFGGTTLYTLGTSFLDENVSTKSSPLFVGLMLGFSSLGPAIGFLLGGYFLNIYVDTPLMPDPTSGLTPSDPRWVGAWWIGFLISSSLFVFVATLMFAYPRELPGVKEIIAAKVSQAHGKVHEAERKNTIRDFPKAIFSLVKNPVFLCVSLAAASEGIGTSGVTTFLPKIIQNQFGQNAGTASIIAGLLSVPGAAGGNIIAGIICRRLKLKVKGMLRFSLITTMICVFLSATAFIYCENSFDTGTITEQCKDGCNGGANCTTFLYRPLCINGTDYFSPCHAGCSDSFIDTASKKEIYSNCSCNDGSQADATSGKCDSDCAKLPIFLPIMFLIILFTFMTAIPGNAVTLRSVPDSQRTFGLGLQWVFVRFLGTIPGPIMFGTIFDSTCKVWQDLGNDAEGSCWIYSNSELAVNIFIIIICVKITTLTLFSTAHFLYHPPAAALGTAPEGSTKMTRDLLSSSSATQLNEGNFEGYENEAVDPDSASDKGTA